MFNMTYIRKHVNMIYAITSGLRSITAACCYDRFYDLLSTMMSEGGKAPTGAVHDQEEIHVICTVLYHTYTYVCVYHLEQ